MKTDFESTYKGLSATQLLAILAEKEQYQALAVEAAERELSNRQLTQGQIQIAKQELDTMRFKSTQQNENTVEVKVATQANRIFQWINPLTFRDPERQVQFLCFILGMSWIINLSSKFFIILDLLAGFEYWDSRALELLLPYIYLPFAIYLLLKRSGTGWTMLAVWVTYRLLFSAFSASNLLTYEDEVGEGFDFDIIYKELLYSLGVIIFFGAILFHICRKTTRRIFGVGIVQATLSIFLTSLLLAFRFYS